MPILTLRTIQQKGKMLYKEYHLIKNNAKWEVKEANAQKALKKFATKNAALQLLNDTQSVRQR